MCPKSLNFCILKTVSVKCFFFCLISLVLSFRYTSRKRALLSRYIHELVHKVQQICLVKIPKHYRTFSAKVYINFIANLCIDIKHYLYTTTIILCIYTYNHNMLIHFKCALLLPIYNHCWSTIHTNILLEHIYTNARFP